MARPPNQGLLIQIGTMLLMVGISWGTVQYALADQQKKNESYEQNQSEVSRQVTDMRIDVAVIKESVKNIERLVRQDGR
jgi:cell division protein FtsB